MSKTPDSFANRTCGKSGSDVDETFTNKHSCQQDKTVYSCLSHDIFLLQTHPWNYADVCKIKCYIFIYTLIQAVYAIRYIMRAKYERYLSSETVTKLMPEIMTIVTKW